MAHFLKKLEKLSSLFSAIFGPLLVTWTGFSLRLVPTWSDSTVFSVSSAFWAGIVQLVLWFAEWIVNLFSQNVNIYVSKNNTFENDSTLNVNFSDDPVKLTFRIEISGSNKLLSKKTTELIFPGQVDLQMTGSNDYCHITSNRVVINLKNILFGQSKHLNGYTQDFTVLLLKNEETFQNNLSVEPHNRLMKQNLKTKVRMFAK